MVFLINLFLVSTFLVLLNFYNDNGLDFFGMHFIYSRDHQAQQFLTNKLLQYY